MARAACADLLHGPAVDVGSGPVGHVSRLELEPSGRAITESEIREVLDEMVDRNGGYPISVEGITRMAPVKAKKPVK